jgi:glycosyltransferase involved in cell wall biosynthesis
MPTKESNQLAVVIPTYNRSRSLRRCLESVYSQTRIPDEIIVVDDGSTDGSTSDLEGQYPGIRVIFQKNQGVSAARNTGIREANSEWIALLDSDDVWLESKCEKQLEALQENPNYQICHAQEKWIYKGQEKQIPKNYRKKSGWIFSDCLPLCAISPSTAIVSRELLISIGLFDQTLPACEDYDLWLRIASRYPVLLVDEALIEKHGGHDDQLSNQRGLDLFRILALEKFLDSPNSKAEYIEMAKRTLLEKCHIVVTGANKSGCTEVADQAAAVRDRFL